jgi:serine/threonine protein kinase
MDEKKEGEGAELVSPQQSVLTHIAARTGEAPRITLNEEDSASVASPLIDAASREKLSLPKGRSTYQLLGEIARGGMGVVLKGHDTDLGRDVAMKVLHRDLSDRPEVIQRFVEEAQIGGQLQHPGIVPVYELGLMADERPYFTMKLVKGRTLATLLAERETTKSGRRRMLGIFEDICQTMGYAHSRGVIHRDLKPANVMVGAFGEVQVVDWGLAKVLARGGTADEKRAREARSIHTILETVRSDGSGSGSDSLVGSVMGTPAYMPPEQAQGQVDRLDERSDVFSLGAILCEILTGAPPYAGESDKTLVQAAQAEQEQALERLDGCGADPELIKLVKQCLMPAPATRPRNAGVLAERLHAHLETVEERAQEAQIEAAEARVREQQERKARKLTLGLAAAVVGMVAVGGGGWLWVANERAAREAEEVRRELAAAEAERALAADVGEVLNEVSLLRGQGAWNEALATLDRASGLAEGGGAGAELHDRIATVRAEVEAEAADLRTEEERLREIEDFLARVDLVERTFGIAATWSRNWRRNDEVYGETFAELGVDVDALSPREVADVLRQRGLVPAIAVGIDRWLATRRRLIDDLTVSGGELDEAFLRAQHLVEIQHEVDPDPLRADLREALLSDDVEMLLALADDDLAGQPPSTIGLLATALDRAGEEARAHRVVRDGISAHPDSYPLRLAAVHMLSQNEVNSWNDVHAEETLAHAHAGLALQPDSVLMLGSLHWTSRNRAYHFMQRGDVVRADQLIRDAADAGEGVIAVLDTARFWRVWTGQAAWWSGDLERARRQLASGSELLPERAFAQTAYGRFLSEQWEIEAALPVFEHVLTLEPANDLGNDGVAQCRVLLELLDGDLDGALAAIDRAFAEDGRTPGIIVNNLAWFFVRLDEEELVAHAAPGKTDAVRRAFHALRDHALVLAEQATERDPGQPAYWNTLGGVRLRIDDPEGAIEAVERSAALGGGAEASDWVLFALAHAQLGDVDEARRCLERSVEDVTEGQWRYLVELEELRDETRRLLASE